MGRFIRIVKAEDKDKLNPNRTEAQVERMKANKDSTKKELSLKSARRALGKYMKQLMDNPPLWEKGEEDEDGFDSVGEINYDALYDDIIFAHNHMIADTFGLDEAQRYAEKTNEETGEVDIPSIMEEPVLTEPLLTALDKMVEHFGEELGFRRQIDEEDNGSLDQSRKTNRVPDDITAWIAQANNPRSKNALLNYFQEKTKHPIRYTTMEDIERLNVPVRVREEDKTLRRVTGRRGFADIPEGMREALSAAEPKQLASAQYKTPEEQKRYYDTGEDTRDAKKIKQFYDKDVFSSPVLRPNEGVRGNPKTMSKWAKIIRNKADKEGLADMKDAIPLVQEDLNRHMRVFLQDRAVGTSGRGGRFGQAASTHKAPDFVTPSFYTAAKEMGVILQDEPNAHDDIAQYFLRGNKPNDQKNREKVAMNLPTLDGAETHPALRSAMDEGVLSELSGSQTASTDIQDLNMEARTERGSDRSARGETSNLPSVEEMQREVKGTRGGVKATKLGRYAASTKRGGQAKDAKDSRLVDLEMMLENNMFVGGKDEYNALRDQVLNDVTGDYRPTYFSEIPDGTDFPEGHPYHGKTTQQIIKASSQFMDNLVGAGRHLLQFKVKLREEGMSKKDIAKLKLNTEDIRRMSTIMNSDDPEKKLNSYGKKNIARFQKCFDAGITQSFVNKVARDTAELRDKAEEFGIDPIDLAEMGARYSESGFSKEGFDEAFANMFGKLTGDVSQGALLRTLYTIKRANETQAENLSRMEESIEQRKKHIDHHHSKPKDDESFDDLSDERKSKLLSEAEECVACHPKHFSASTAEEARTAHDDSRISAFKHRRVMVPQLDFRFNPVTMKSDFIPLLPTEGQQSLAEMAHYVLGGKKSFEDYVSELENKAKYYQGGKDSVRKEIKREMKKAAMNYDEKIENLDVKFPGLHFKDMKIQPMGAARTPASTRVALGMLAPSTFMDDKSIEDLRVKNLFNAQMSGIVEAFDILRDVKNGEFADDKGKKVSINSLKDKKGMRAFIKSFSNKMNSASKQQVRLKRYNNLMRDIEDVKQQHDLELEMWEQEYGQRVKNGNLSEKVNPEGYERVMQRKQDISDEFAGHLTDRLHAIRDGRVELSEDAVQGDRELQIPSHAMQLHGIPSDGNITVGGEDYRIVDIRPPRKAGQSTRLIIDRPLSDSVPKGRDAIGLDTSNLAKNKLTQPREQMIFERKAMEDGVTDVEDYFKRMKGKVNRIQKNTDNLSKNEDYNKRKSAQALGALLKTITFNEKTKKYENTLMPILKEESEKGMVEKMLSLREKMYTDSDGLPLQQVFMGDDSGGERASNLYAPDEYLVGQQGSTGGTGLTFMDNNMHLPNIPDAARLQLLSKKHNKRMLSNKELNAYFDAVHHETDVSMDSIQDYMTDEEKEEYSLSEQPSEDTKEGLHERDVARAIQNSHYDDATLDKIARGETFDEPHIRGGPTACGTCGGARAITMDDAVSYIRAHNKQLRHAHPESKAMKAEIKKVLRPPNKKNFDDSEKEPHNHHHVTCPDCDQEHPDSHTGKCADGVCAHCHGSGIVDPEDDAPLNGYEYTDEDGNTHTYEGTKDNKSHGKQYDVNRLMDKIGRISGIKGRIPTKSLALEVFKDNVASGAFAPLTKIKYIQRMNRQKYELADEESRNKAKTWKDILAQKGKGDVSEGERRQPTSVEEATSTEFAMREAEKELPENKAMSDALTRAYHNNMIESRAKEMANMAINNGQDEEAVMELLRTIVNHPDNASAHGDHEHEVSRAMSQLHEYATKHLIVTGKNEKDKPMKDTQEFGFTESGYAHRLRNPSDYDDLHYNDGRFLTHHEEAMGIHAPENAGIPHTLDVDDILHLFRHSPELLSAWDRHTGENNFNEEEAQKMKNLAMTGMENPKKGDFDNGYQPLVEQQLSKMGHSKLNELMDDFKYTDQQREGLENVQTDSPELTWKDDIKSKLNQSKRNKYFSRELEEGEFARGQQRVGMDKTYNDVVKASIKPMWTEYLKLTGLKKLFARYDGISHPGFHQKVVSAMKAAGMSADTKLDEGNFMQLAQGNAPLMTQAYNEAARLMGFDDENDMETKARFDSKNRDGMSGKQFKDEIMNSATPINVKSMPLENSEEVFNASVAHNFSVDSEAKARDKAIYDQMWGVAQMEFTPNHRYEQKMTNLIAESGYGSAKEMQDAHHEGTLPKETLDEIENAQKAIKKFHPTWIAPRYDDLNIYDSLAASSHQQKQPMSQMDVPQNLPEFQLSPQPSVPQLQQQPQEENSQ